LKQVIENHSSKGGVNITLGNKNIKILKNNITISDSPQRHHNSKLEKVRLSLESNKEFKEDHNYRNKYEAFEPDDISILSPAK